MSAFRVDHPKNPGKPSVTAVDEVPRIGDAGQTDGAREGDPQTDRG
jgi:hypothetical protein